MCFTVPTILAFIVWTSAIAIPDETSLNPVAVLNKRNSYNCKGSGLCGSTPVKYCDQAVNTLICNDDHNYRAPGYVFAPLLFFQPVNRSLTTNFLKTEAAKPSAAIAGQIAMAMAVEYSSRAQIVDKVAQRVSFQETRCGGITRKFRTLVAEFVAASSMIVAVRSLSTISRIVTIGARDWSQSSGVNCAF
jgi:hypothetical protein